MASVTMPYKLQIFLPDDLRKTLKRLANQYDTSMQQFLVTLLTETTTRLREHTDPALHEVMTAQVSEHA
jgi:hypothetical protein